MKALLFDFGGTLDSDGLNWGDRFFPLYRNAGLAPSRFLFNKAFWRADDELTARHGLGAESRLDLKQTVDLQVKDTLAALAPQREDAGAAIAERFVADCRRAFDRNRPLLKRLKERFRLGIVSNFYGNLSGLLEKEGLAEYFETVADSTIVGHTKPSREIFLHAVDALGVRPEDCVMIGDSIPRDMKGAEGLVMPHVLLNPSAEACCAKAPRIGTLTELEGVL